MFRYNVCFKWFHHRVWIIWSNCLRCNPRADDITEFELPIHNLNKNTTIAWITSSDSVFRINVIIVSNFTRFSHANLLKLLNVLLETNNIQYYSTTTLLFSKAETSHFLYLNKCVKKTYLPHKILSLLVDVDSIDYILEYRIFAFEKLEYELQSVAPLSDL